MEEYTFIKTPERCLVCGAKWKGGASAPGCPMPEYARVFYDCGASMSVEESSLFPHEVFHILFKNCGGLACIPLNKS